MISLCLQLLAYAPTWRSRLVKSHSCYVTLWYFFYQSVNHRCLEWIQLLHSPFQSSSSAAVGRCSYRHSVWTLVWHRKLMSSHEEIKICFVKPLQSLNLCTDQSRGLDIHPVLCADLSTLQHRGQWRQHCRYEGQWGCIVRVSSFSSENTVGGKKLHSCWSVCGWKSLLCHL